MIKLLISVVLLVRWGRIQAMKKLLLTLILPFTASAIEVGDCINLDRVKSDDPGYWFKVDAVNADSYDATHAIFGTEKTLPKKFRFVVVDCPTDEQKSSIKAAAKSIQLKAIDDLIANERLKKTMAQEQVEDADGKIDHLNAQKAEIESK